MTNHLSESRKVIYRNMSLDVLEKRIAGLLPDKEYWGDLNLSRQEYDTLIAKLAEAADRNPVFNNRGNLMEKYPVCMITGIIFFFRYEYEQNFWDDYAQKFGREFHQQEKRSIGEAILRNLRRYGFSPLEKENTKRPYVDSLIHQAGVPDSCLDDLFYVLSVDNSVVFDPQEIMDDLLGFRNHLIRKPVENYIQTDPQRASELLADLHEVMQENAEGMLNADSRFAESYQQWKEKQSSHKVGNGKPKNMIQRPYLCFEKDGRGICLVLPAVVMENTYVSICTWSIEAGDYHNCIRCMVVPNGGQHLIQQRTIAVPLASEYKIALYHDCDPEKEQVQWTVSGLGEQGYLLFDPSGRQNRTSYLSSQYNVLILKRGKGELTDLRDIQKVFEEFPGVGSDCQSILLYPETSDARMCLAFPKNRRLTFHTRIQLQLQVSLLGNTLFGEQAHQQGTDCFTVFPEMNLTSKYDFQLRDITIRLRHRQSGWSSKMLLTALPVGPDGLFQLRCGLDDPEMPLYGHYELRIYHSEYLSRVTEFWYVPLIPYREIKSPWPVQNKEKEQPAFCYKKIPDCELEFPPDIDMEEERETREIYVRSQILKPCIRGTFKYSGKPSPFSVNFTKSIRAFSFAFWKDGSTEEVSFGETVARFFLDELSDDKYWLLAVLQVQGADPQTELLIRTVNGIEARIPLRFEKNGKLRFSMDCIQDLLYQRPLPADLIFHYQNGAEERQVKLARICKRAKFDNPILYRDSDGLDPEIFIPLMEEYPDVFLLRKFNDPSFKLGIDMSRRKPYENHPYVAVPLDEVLLPGRYQLQSPDEEEDTFLSLKPSPENGLIRKFRKSSDTLEFVLEMAVTLFDQKKGLSNIYKNYLCPKQLIRPECLDDRMLKIIILLCKFCYADHILSQETLEAYRQILSAISRSYLTGSERFRIIQILYEENATVDDWEICEQLLNLSLFEVSSRQGISKEFVDTLYQDFPQLGILLMLRADFPLSGVLPKLKETVGTEALEHIMGLDRTDLDIQEKRMRLVRYWKGLPDSQIQISFSPEISGNSDDIQPMMQMRGFHAWLDVSKMPDTGIYFNNSRFIDQYVNWYLRCYERNDEIAKRVKIAFCRMMDPVTDRLRSAPATVDFVRPYLRALSHRGKNSPPLNFIYRLGVAAFLFQLPEKFGVSPSEKQDFIRFLMEASEIFPKLAKRDMLMAATYIYLKSKE